MILSPTFDLVEQRIANLLKKSILKLKKSILSRLANLIGSEFAVF